MAFFSLSHGDGCQRKQNKSVDQRAPQIGYEGIKSLWSLDMKNYLVTGGLLSLIESNNNVYYLLTNYDDKEINTRENMSYNYFCYICLYFNVLWFFDLFASLSSEACNTVNS